MPLPPLLTVPKFQQFLGNPCRTFVVAGFPFLNSLAQQISVIEKIFLPFLGFLEQFHLAARPTTPRRAFRHAEKIAGWTAAGTLLRLPARLDVPIKLGIFVGRVDDRFGDGVDLRHGGGSLNDLLFARVRDYC